MTVACRLARFYQPSIRARLGRGRERSPAHEGIRGVGAPSIQRPWSSGQGNTRAHPPVEPARDRGIHSRELLSINAAVRFSDKVRHPLRRLGQFSTDVFVERQGPLGAGAGIFRVSAQRRRAWAPLGSTIGGGVAITLFPSRGRFGSRAAVRGARCRAGRAPARAGSCSYLSLVGRSVNIEILRISTPVMVVAHSMPTSYPGTPTARLALNTLPSRRSA